MIGYDKYLGASRSLYYNLSLSTEYKLNFSQVLKYKINGRAFAIQEVHTYPKSHHELNIWQRISPFKVRVLQPRLT
jgi:hypothetical protein